MKLINLIEPNNKIDEEEEEEIENIKKGYLLNQIKNEKLKFYLKGKIINKFSDFLKIEEDFLLDQIELGKGIAKNNLLKENVFLIFLSVITKIPLIIVCKPDTRKSLSAQLIYNSMRGIYSKNKFFIKFPAIIQNQQSQKI